MQVLPSKGAASASRGRVLLAHYKTPGASSAAAAATAASNAAAARAGLLPAADMAGPIVVGPFNGAGEQGSACGTSCPLFTVPWCTLLTCAVPRVQRSHEWVRLRGPAAILPGCWQGRSHERRRPREDAALCVGRATAGAAAQGAGPICAVLVQVQVEAHFLVWARRRLRSVKGGREHISAHVAQACHLWYQTEHRCLISHGAYFAEWHAGWACWSAIIMILGKCNTAEHTIANSRVHT